VKRKAKQGIYWGCLNYPDCRYRVRPSEAKEQEA
jgi:ssDNA-binding Zn-finger/Zn-ribbon topoisomerase 1